jgi:hypothetical protein
MINKEPTDNIAPVEKPERKKREEFIEVILVRSDEEAALVQYEHKGELIGVIVPRKYVPEDRKVPKDIIEAGIVYGDKWSEALTGITDEATAKEIEQALYKMSIWTVKDMLANISATKSAIFMATEKFLGKLLLYAETEIRKQK